MTWRGPASSSASISRCSSGTAWGLVALELAAAQPDRVGTVVMIDSANLTRAAALQPGMTVGRTIGSGHFSPLAVPEQVNAMLERFLATAR